MTPRKLDPAKAGWIHKQFGAAVEKCPHCPSEARPMVRESRYTLIGRVRQKICLDCRVDWLTLERVYNPKKEIADELMANTLWIIQEAQAKLKELEKVMTG